MAPAPVHGLRGVGVAVDEAGHQHLPPHVPGLVDPVVFLEGAGLPDAGDDVPLDDDGHPLLDCGIVPDEEIRVLKQDCFTAH